MSANTNDIHFVVYVDANTSYCHDCDRFLPNAHADYHRENCPVVDG